MLVDHFSGIRQLYIAISAIKQGNVQLILQSLNRFADEWLGNEHFFTRPRHVIRSQGRKPLNRGAQGYRRYSESAAS